MAIDLKKEIGPNMSIVLVIPNESYVVTINDVAKQLSKSYSKISYVSLNKLYFPLIKILKANEADVTKFFIIDGITKTAMSDPGNIPNCFFVSGPDNLTELAISMRKVLTTNKSEILFFDSLSTLLLYKNVQLVKQFVHSVVGMMGAMNCIAVFTCLEGKVENDLIRDISMFIDGIVHVK